MRTTRKQSGSVEANGTELYYEVTGDGPPVLFISGATGDAGHFSRTAEGLSRDYTVVTYDRRGNSRSPAPAGWESTSVPEQADDTAALIRALGLDRPVVFGTSGGGGILVSFVERHAKLASGAIVHEPVLMPVSPSAEQVGAQLQQMIGEGMAAGGPSKAMELFVRWAAGEDGFAALDTKLRKRMLANGEVFFSREIEAFVSFNPNAKALKKASIPIHAAYGEENVNLPHAEGAVWLAETLGCPLHVMPGAHVPYFTCPEAFEASLRPILASIN